MTRARKTAGADRLQESVGPIDGFRGDPMERAKMQALAEEFRRAAETRHPDEPLTPLQQRMQSGSI